MNAPTEQQAPWRPSDTLANRLLLVRTEYGLSQREAAERCGIPFGSWQGMEKGRQSRGLDVKVARISLALGVDRDWLMWGGALHTQNDPHPGGPGGGQVPPVGLEPTTCGLKVRNPARTPTDGT